MSDYGIFSSYEGRQGTANGQDSWAFSRMHRALDSWMRTLVVGRRQKSESIEVALDKE